MQLVLGTFTADGQATFASTIVVLGAQLKIQANNSEYTCGGAAETARNNLIAAGHTITDAGCV